MRQLTKKGILMPETLKIIIAVLSIALLIYLAVSLFGILRGQYSREQASSHLEQIVQKAGVMRQDNIANHHVLILNPKDWYLVSYSVEDVTSIFTIPKSMPSVCKGQSCLCICPADYEIEAQSSPIRDFDRGGHVDYFYYKDAYGGKLNGVKKCEKEGVCVIVDKLVISHKVDYYVYLPYTPIIERHKDEPVNWISLRKLPKTINLDKHGDYIQISEVVNK